jgi:tetratricopeptide (TPR) repeat protein
MFLALTDRGVRERLLLRRTYGQLMIAMADFERAGGRVQELDDDTLNVRRQTVMLTLGTAVFVAVVIALHALIGAPWWFAALILGVYVVISAVAHWAVLALTGGADGEGRRSASEFVSGVAAACIKGSLVFVGVVAAQNAAAVINAGEWLSGLAVAAVGVIAVTCCAVPVGYLERLTRKRREIAFAHTAKSDAVLYLRSFNDDEFRLFTLFSPPGLRYRFLPSRVRFEEFLVSTLHGTGEVVSVGRPGERLPALGAARTYWDEENWRDAIRTTSSRVSALTLLAGRTPSLAWEVGQLRDLGLLGKTLILFPPDGAPATAERYAFIVDAVELGAEHQLPAELLNMLTAIAFASDGTPVHYLTGGRDWSSYLATTMHFFLVLAGDISFDQAGALTLVDELTEDPFFQAAYLLDKGARDDAIALISMAEQSPDNASRAVARAWVAAEFDRDGRRAKEILETARQAFGTQSGEIDFDEALAELADVEAGVRQPRDILRQRYPKSYRRSRDAVRAGRAALGLIEGVRFMRAMQEIDEADDTGDYERALTLAREATQFVEGEGAATIQATTLLLAASALLGLKRYDEAEEEYQRVSNLRGAPRLRVSPLAPSLDPADLVDDALAGLVTIAQARGEHEVQLSRLLRLRKFREDYGSTESSAEVGLDLCRAYGERGALKEAHKWVTVARKEYLSVGQVDGAAQCLYFKALIERDEGRPDTASLLAKKAVDDARTVGNSALETNARALLAQLRG